MRRFVSVLVLLAAMLPPAAGQDGLVTFAFDQGQDRLLRIAEVGCPDGITVFLDDASATLGLDNALSLYVLPDGAVLATDSFIPRNILIMQDATFDRDALDPGETRVWFDGQLPGGVQMSLPVAIAPGPDGDMFVLDNHAINAAAPEAIYRLHDADASGSIDATEITTHFEIAPPGDDSTRSFALAFDDLGAAYVFDLRPPATIRRVTPDGAQMADFVTEVDLLTLTGAWSLSSALASIDVLRSRGELIVPVENTDGTFGFAALSDVDASGAIDAAAEVRIVWSETGHADGFTVGAPRDLRILADDSLVWTDSETDHVWRSFDLNADGDHDDAGEMQEVYASSGSRITATGLVTVAGTFDFTPTPDLDGNGGVDVIDLAILLANFGRTTADRSQGQVDGVGGVDIGDLALLLANYGCG